MVDRLILLKFWFQAIVLLFDLFEKLLELADLISLFIALDLFLLRKLGDLSIKFQFKLIVLLSQLRLDLFGFREIFL